MNNDNTIISITSIPQRLNNCTIDIINILKKNKLCLPILLNIPLLYKKWGTHTIPNIILNDNDIILYHPIKDYGPSTKLLGALEYIENNPKYEYIITMDDDEYYNNIDEYLDFMFDNSNKYFNYILTIGGIKLNNYPYMNNNGLIYNNSNIFVDIPAGLFGCVYPIHYFKNNKIIFELYNDLPEGIFNDDDLYFGIIAGYMKIPIYSLKLPINIKLIDHQESKKSGVVDKTNIRREINESNIIQYACSKLYLPNIFTKNIII